jgi:conjugative transfer region protein TrbK
MKIEHWLTPENLGLVALGIVVGAIGLIGVEAACDADVAARAKPASALSTGAPPKGRTIDPELLRCAQLPIEQADDPECRALWAAQRRKFLKPREGREDSGETLDMFPSLPRALEKPLPKPAPAQESE